MTVEFALFLSPEGIALAHRQSAGHWAFIGETRLDVDDLDAALGDLRKLGEARGGAKGALDALVVLPDDQILYTSLTAPTDDPDLMAERVAEGLDGMTPYAVADLVYDNRVIEVDRVKLAVIARETLGEAQVFAEAHGFKPTGFAAMPPLERFPGLPVFRDSDGKGPDLPEGGLVFGADTWGAPEPTPADLPGAAEAPGPVADAINAPLASGSPDGASEKGAASEIGAKSADPADVSDAGTEPAPATPSGGPSMSDDAEPPARPGSAGVSGTPEATGPTETPASPDKSTDTPLPDATASSGAPDVEPASTAPAEPAKTAASVSTTKRGKAAKPAKGGRPIRSDKTGTGPVSGGHKRRITPGSTTSDTDNTLSPDRGGDDAPYTGPQPSFTARRGKAAGRGEASGRLVGDTSSRLGFGAPTETNRGPVLHPDAEPLGSGASGRKTSRIAEQLSRIRDASKLRPEETDPVARDAASDTTAPATAEGGTDNADDPLGSPTITSPLTGQAVVAPEEAAPDRPSGLASRLAGRRDGRGAVDDKMSATDTTLTSGLLARKTPEPSGPSLRMGLILTLILLALLAGLAAWSVVFLPGNPIGRLFGPESDPLQVEAPFDADTPPEIVDAPVMAPDTPAISDAPTDTADVAALEPDPGPENAPAEPEALPDIDADLDLEPLPPLPEDLLPSLEETERLYAEDGVWPRTPERPALAPPDTLDGLYTSSVDPAITGFDAIALPESRVDPNETLRRVPSPPPFGTTITLDARGLVEPTPDGVITPDGAFVIEGSPPVVAIQRPREIAAPAADPDLGPILQVENAILGASRPPPRPEDLSELRERSLLGGLSVTELSGVRPTVRPTSAQETAASASLFRDAADAEPGPAASAGGTALAITASIPPRVRPGNIEAIVAAAVRAPAAVVPASSVAAAPRIPTNTSVARAATEANALRLRDVNLIGVTGTPSNRRALVRLPSGRFVRVGVGDRLDGGRVAAIGGETLQYVRRGRNITLEIPG